MAVLKDLEQQMEREVKAKLNDLERETKARAQAIMDEVRRDTLGDNIGGPAPSKPRQSNGAKTRKSSGNGRRRKNAPEGQRKQQTLEQIQAQPGISVPEIATKLGTDKTGLYRYVNELRDEGAIRKEGKQLFPATTIPAPDTSTSVPETPASV